MTSRLKHKLELENINVKSAYLNESFVSIGTPLPDLASSKRDKLEYVPEWQQEVRDDKGRRRFHGAFTGGFSAGYFNSVGSKEGWAPSEFKSSRSNRANRIQRPEDFMDEEDLQQMKDDRRLENTQTFREDVETPRDKLASLILPAASSIGEELLSKLGWKRGQGIGPRVTPAKRKRQGAIVDESAAHLTFAPIDVKLVIYRAKEDKHGLGYPSLRSDRPSGATQWHDGRTVLSAFELGPTGVKQDKWFPLPDIPSEWRPRPARVWGTTRKWDEEVDVPAAPTATSLPTAQLTHEQRGAALGEPPSAPTHVIIPPLSPRTASAALQGFIPYGDDLAKQDRYRSYLSSQTYNSKTPRPTLRLGAIDDINKELADFSASARIFKPMSFAMSNRFTSGSASLASTDLKQPRPGLHLHAPETSAPPPVSDVVEPKSVKEQAAHRGDYGSFTREVKAFYPEKLLCRRFGVPNPHPDGEPQPPPEPAIDVPLESFDQSTSTADHEESRPTSLGEVGMADDSEQGRDTLNYVKPAMDIFKAIFETPESDEDAEDETADMEAAKAGGDEPLEGSTPLPHDVAAVDLADFKPVFKLKKDKGSASGGSQERKKRKEKKRKGVLSFDTGEEEETERKRPRDGSEMG